MSVSKVSDIRPFSAGTADGRGIAVAATNSPGTTIHVGTGGKTQIVEIEAVNQSGSDDSLTLEWGGTSSSDHIKVTVHANEGVRQIWSGIIVGALTIKAFVGVANSCTIFGRISELG